MNYLFHLFLAEPTRDSRLGALLGDFVKGTLDGFPPALREGIRRHRRLDHFAQGNEHFLRSKRRIDPRFGLFRGILVDVFYDHFLARHWKDYSSESLEVFAAAIYRILEQNALSLPPGLKETAPRMIAGNWLVSYREPESVGIALERLSRRISRPNPLPDGLQALRAGYAGLQSDFRSFLPEAVRFLPKARA